MHRVVASLCVPGGNTFLLFLAQVGTQAGFVSGCLLGFVFFIAFSAYALALWYGSVRIIAGSMNGGDVVTVRPPRFVSKFTFLCSTLPGSNLLLTVIRVQSSNRPQP